MRAAAFPVNEKTLVWATPSIVTEAWDATTEIVCVIYSLRKVLDPLQMKNDTLAYVQVGELSPVALQWFRKQGVEVCMYALGKYQILCTK